MLNKFKPPILRTLNNFLQVNRNIWVITFMSFPLEEIGTCLKLYSLEAIKTLLPLYLASSSSIMSGMTSSIPEMSDSSSLELDSSSAED